VKIGLREWERMNLSGLNGEVYIFTLRDLEMKVSRFKSKFVKVGE